MITESKVIEINCLADDFCKNFSAQLKKYQLEAPKSSWATRAICRKSSSSGSLSMAFS